jgi:hypothetical protein
MTRGRTRCVKIPGEKVKRGGKEKSWIPAGAGIT